MRDSSAFKLIVFKLLTVFDPSIELSPTVVRASQAPAELAFLRKSITRLVSLETENSGLIHTASKTSKNKESLLLWSMACTMKHMIKSPHERLGLFIYSDHKWSAMWYSHNENFNCILNVNVSHTNDNFSICTHLASRRHQTICSTRFNIPLLIVNYQVSIA